MYHLLRFRKKRVSFIETTLRTLLFTKISLKSSGLSISEKIPILYVAYENIKNDECSSSIHGLMII